MKTAQKYYRQIAIMNIDVQNLDMWTVCNYRVLIPFCQSVTLFFGDTFIYIFEVFVAAVLLVIIPDI